MLMGAFSVFTLVAVMGLSIVASIWRGHSVDPFYPVLHGATSLFGAALVIFAAQEGDERLNVNIGLAVVIIVLGVLMGILGKKGKQIPKAIIAAHVGLAVVCYGILGFFALNPYAILI
jgi:hypothetical protein